MTIPPRDIILLSHAGFGVMGCMAALWVVAESLGAAPTNTPRIRIAAYVTALCIAAAWILGGYWYVVFYPAEKALILNGPWPFAHNVFMEIKEHLFFVTGILALLLPIATRERIDTNPSARWLVLSIAGLIVVTGLAVEGSGAIIDHGVKVALARTVSKQKP